jgi:hypothetical protein
MSVLVNTTRHFEIEVTDEGVRKDPASLSVTITLPNNTSVTYVYGTDAEVVRTQVGIYYVDFLLASVGTYRVVWEASGDFAAIQELDLEVVYPAQGVVIQVMAGLVASSGATVTVTDMSGALLGSGVSDTTGEVTFPLVAGVYAVSASKAGHISSTTTITVIGSQPPTVEEFSVTITDLQITPPVVSKCKVYGFVEGDDVRVLIEILNVPLAGGGSYTFRNVASTSGTLTIMTRNKYWEADLPIRALARVSIPTVGTSKLFHVPVSASASFADIPRVTKGRNYS